MISFPTMNPIAIHIGPLTIYWYGVLYIVGLGIIFYILKKQQVLTRHPPLLNQQELQELMTYGALGVLIGGRIGYMFFYNTEMLLYHPLVFATTLVKIWQGGMSFHGGLIGVLLSIKIFTLRYQKAYFQITDVIAPLVPLALGLGRLGNFINQELWGRVSEVPWAMVFPLAGPLPRHPSQLYEFLLEGIVLYSLLHYLAKKKLPPAALSSFFLIGYGIIRFNIEWFREPDAHIGFIWHIFTLGQLLSLPMIMIGCYLLTTAYGNPQRLCNNI
jgi:phosphatidylglycerol:prolipoprotein diacylglycerol transferase